VSIMRASIDWHSDWKTDSSPKLERHGENWMGVMAGKG
jgi:hypothetical protein